MQHRSKRTRVAPLLCSKDLGEGSCQGDDPLISRDQGNHILRPETVPGSTLLRTPMAMVLLAQSKLLEFGDACHHCWSFSCDVSVSHFLTRCHRRLRERLKPSPWIWWMRRVDSQTWVHGHSICEEFSRLCETYPSGCWFDSNKKPT